LAAKIIGGALQSSILTTPGGAASTISLATLVGETPIRSMGILFVALGINFCCK